MFKPLGFSKGIAVLALVFICAPAVAQVTFQEFDECCVITSMSADGSVAVGAFGAGLTEDVIRWTAAGGVVKIGAPNAVDFRSSRSSAESGCSFCGPIAFGLASVLGFASSTSLGVSPLMNDGFGLRLGLLRHQHAHGNRGQGCECSLSRVFPPH
jgi:hypothetical protein